MPHSQSFLDTMAGEFVERQIRKNVEDAMRSSANKGLDGAGIVKETLSSVFTGKIYELANKVPGFSIPLLGTALAGWVANTDLIDKLLPDDSRPGVKQAKFLLKHVAPHIVIGATEGVADALNRAIGKTVSDPTTTAPSDMKKPLDRLFYTPEWPDRLFVPSRDSVTQDILWEDEYPNDPSKNVPVISDRDWRIKKDAWDVAHTETVKQQGQGRNQQQITVPKKPFPCKEVSLADGVAMIGSRASLSGDVEALKKLLSKKGWLDSLSEDAQKVVLALSKTKSALPVIDRAVGEDFFKDLPNKVDPAWLNLLGKHYASLIQPDGTFLKADYAAIVETIDDWMGAELQAKTNVKVWASKAYSAYKNGSIPFGKALKLFFIGVGVSAPIWIACIGSLFSFLASALMFIAAASADVSVSFLGFANGQMAAAAATLVSAWTIAILLTFLSPVELVLSLFTRWMNFEKGWLTDVGKKISVLVACYGALAAVMVLVGASVSLRFLLPVTALLALGTAQMVGLAEKIWGINRVWGLQAAKGFKWITTLLFLAMILLTVWQILGTDIMKGVKEILDFVQKHSVVRFVIYLGISSVLAGLVLKWFETTETYEKGQWSRTRESSWLARLIALAFVVTVSSWAFVDPPNERYKPFYTPTVAEVVAKEAAELKRLEAHTEALRLKQAQEAKDVRVEAKLPQRRQSRAKKSTSSAMSDCDKLSYDARKQIGCP